MVVTVNYAELELRVVADLIDELESQGCACDLLYGHNKCAIHEKASYLRLAVQKLMSK